MAKKISKELPEDYGVRLQLAKLREVEENAERLYLANQKSRVENEKAVESLCYITVAQNVFQETLSAIADVIKAGAERCALEIGATPAQSDGLNKFFRGLLQELSRLEVKIPTTTETDSRLEHSNAATKKLTRGH